MGGGGFIVLCGIITNDSGLNRRVLANISTNYSVIQMGHNPSVLFFKDIIDFKQ